MNSLQTYNNNLTPSSGIIAFATTTNVVYTGISERDKNLFLHPDDIQPEKKCIHKKTIMKGEKNNDNDKNV